MSREDILYLCMLLISIPLGHLVKLSGSPAKKQFCCTVAGFALVICLLGFGIWHSLLTIIGAYLIVVVLGPRHCQWPAFIYVFAYLFFFRTCPYFGFSKPPMYANAVQLLVTLRSCTLLFEVFDPEITGNRDAAITTPSFYEFISYCYCYCGLMTGPYYRYKTYKDFLAQPNPEKISTFGPALRRFKLAPLIGAMYLVMAVYFPYNHIGTDAYVNHPWGLVYHLAYLVPAFHGFRWRFYIGWILAESSCMMLGLGAYPFETEPKPGLGPSKPIAPADGTTDCKNYIKQHESDTHSFDTIHNIRLFEVEFSPCMSRIMKDWNMTVQWWMSVFVHRKLPFANRNARLFVTLLVSAFWHGVAPGYYLTFLSVPLIVISEYRMAKAIKPYLSEKQHYWYDWCSWFFLYRAMEYTGCGFMLLQLGPCLAAWKSLYFIGHIVIVMFLIIPVFIPKRKCPDEEKKVS